MSPFITSQLLSSPKNRIVIDVLQACFKNDEETQQKLAAQIYAMFTDISGTVSHTIKNINYLTWTFFEFQAKTEKVYEFGPEHLLLVIANRVNDIYFEDLTQRQKFEEFLQHKSKSLKKSRIAPLWDVDSALVTVDGIPYNELISIDRNLSEDHADEHKSNSMTKKLKEMRSNFLTEKIVMPGWDGYIIHPMDVMNRVLLKSSPESCRILIQNLHKMKFALPLVIPRLSKKPKILAWPLIGIHCEHKKRNFNVFRDSHHVVAFVRLGHSNMDSHKESFYIEILVVYKLYMINTYVIYTQ